MRCVGLVSNMVKIVGIYYSYNEKLENQENFKRYIIKIEQFLRIWRIRDLLIAGNITAFKTLAFSKIVHPVLVKTISNLIIHELNKIKKKLYRNLAILKENMTISVQIMKIEVSKMFTYCIK